MFRSYLHFSVPIYQYASTIALFLLLRSLLHVSIMVVIRQVSLFSVWVIMPAASFSCTSMLFSSPSSIHTQLMYGMKDDQLLFCFSIPWESLYGFKNGVYSPQVSFSEWHVVGRNRYEAFFFLLLYLLSIVVLHGEMSVQIQSAL